MDDAAGLYVLCSNLINTTTTGAGGGGGEHDMPQKSFVIHKHK